MERYVKLTADVSTLKFGDVIGGEGPFATARMMVVSPSRGGGMRIVFLNEDLPRFYGPPGALTGISGEGWMVYEIVE